MAVRKEISSVTGKVQARKIAIYIGSDHCKSYTLLYLLDRVSTRVAEKKENHPSIDFEAVSFLSYRII